MATVSGDSSRSLAVGDWGRAGEADSKSDRYLAKRLAAAGADYKGVALITFLLGSAVGALAWLAIGVALEHWVVPGGLPRWARWSWLAALLTALAAAAVRWIVPLVRYRVNLVYAARAIEQEHPDLHNDIVNAVLVKAHPDGSAPMVVRSLERRAAKRLSGLPAEGVIDRSLAVRLACALAVLVGAACLYQVVAPKSLVMSMARLIAPWAGVAAPSRVQISAPRLSWRMPGDDREAAAAGDLEGQRLELNGAVATLVRGRQLVVAVDVRGLRREERPTLTVTPMRDDGSFDAAAATWQAGMERRRASDTHVAVLPDAARGIDHSLEFVVAAGDARTEPVRVAVVDSPSLLVREIRYDYPAYTRLPPETTQWQGDVRAVEGTRVTVVAESNRPLAEAWIEFDGSGKHDRVMKIGASDLARATASFDLRMNADRSAPEHATYRLVFRPRGADGSKAEQVVGQMDHRIEVVADLAPEISIEHPREPSLRVPADAPVNVAVRAVDPDFGLARVGIEMRLQDGRPLPDIVILGKPTAGAFKGVAEFVPAKLGAAAGTAIEYRGVAADTRPQQPNVAHTQWQKLIIDPSAPPPAPPPKSDVPREQDPQADKQGGEEGSADQQDGRQEKGSAQNGKQQDGKQQDGKQQDGKQPNGGGEAAEGQEGRPQDQSQSDGRQSEGKKEPGQDEPGKQSGANDGSQKGSQQSNDAGSSGAKQSGQQPQQPGGNQKTNGSDAAGGGEQSGVKAQDGGEAESKSGGRDGKGQQGDGRNQQQQQQQQPGAKQGGRQKPRDTVAADGTNDGKAMERILEHRRQQEGQQGQQDQQRQKQGQQGQKQEQGQKQQGQQGQQGQKKQDCPDCAGPDGKPCGKPGCSSCKGGGSKPGGGGASGSSSGGGGQQSGQGEEQGQGQQQGQKEGQGQGQEGQGKQGQGQQGQGQGKEGQSKEGQGDGGQGQNGQGNEQGNQQDASDGKQPGTQPGKQSGKGAEGAGQPAASGGQPSEQSGEGQPGAGEGAGSKPSGGEQAGEGKGSRPAKDGEKGDARAGAGDDPGNETSERGAKQGPASGEQPSDQTKPGQKGQPGQEGKPGEQSQQGQEGLQAGKPSDQVSPTGRGGWSNGERELRRGDGAAGDPPPARETEWGEQDLASARNAADLAIEHLRKSVEAGRTDVLEQLGWTPEQARAFLDRWQSLRRLAGSDDPRQRGEFDRAIRSLGLRPDGVRSSRDVPADVKGGQAEGRRTRPPSEYRDQVKAYLQGTGAE